MVDRERLSSRLLEAPQSGGPPFGHGDMRPGKHPSRWAGPIRSGFPRATAAPRMAQRQEEKMKLMPDGVRLLHHPEHRGRSGPNDATGGTLPLTADLDLILPSPGEEDPLRSHWTTTSPPKLRRPRSRGRPVQRVAAISTIGAPSAHRRTRSCPRGPPHYQTAGWLRQQLSVSERRQSHEDAHETDICHLSWPC